jgi:hypothetical protein
MQHLKEAGMPSLSPGSFGEPDRSIMKKPPAIFPPWEVLPVGSELRHLAETLNCPGGYVFWSFLAFMAGLIGTARRFRAWTAFEVPCNIYLALIGAPSASKTLPFRLFRDFCIEAEREEAEALRRTHGDEAAARHRIIIDHVSAPSLIDFAAANPRGMTQAVDELSRILPGNNQIRPLHLEGYNGSVARVDLLTRPSQTADKFLLSIVGTIQTELFQELIKKDRDGLIPRFLPAPEEPVIPTIPHAEADFGWLPPMQRRLRRLHDSPAVMVMDEAAKGTFGEWWKAHRTRTSHFDGPLAAFENKATGTTLRLAGVRSLIAWACREDDTLPPDTIGQEDVLAAITMVEDYLRPAARQIYGEAIVPGAEGGTRRLAGWLLQHRPQRFNARALYRGRAIRGLSTAEDMAEATEHLTRANWVRPARKPGKVGRPLSDFLVNPTVLNWAEERGL